MTRDTTNGGIVQNQETQNQGVQRGQVLMLGAMLFSMFFGAGNLIVPSLLGLQAGASALPATVGFLITGIGLPILGIIVVAMCGDIRQLAGRVHPVFARVFIAAIYLIIGPFLVLPRTSTTAFEIMKPILPESFASSSLVLIVFSVLFFGATVCLALKPGRLVRIMGRFSAPALITLLVLLVGGALFGSGQPAAPAQAPYDNSVFVQGFLTGYQTVDLLAALCFGIVVALNARGQGITGEKNMVKAISGAGLITCVLMGIIYSGLVYVGVTMSAEIPEATNGASVLAAAANAHFGSAGSVLIAAIFLLATLNVGTGLVTCCAEYFSEEFQGIPYVVWAVIFALVSCALSLQGLDAILTLSVPLLNAMYAPSIVMVALGLFHARTDKLPRVWPWGVLLTAVASFVMSIRDSFFAGAWLPMDMLPGAQFGLSWVWVSLLGILIGALLSRRSGK